MKQCGMGECQRILVLCGDASAPYDTVCVPGTPRIEVCDGLDNNCNGEVDEDHMCERPVEGVAVVPRMRCIHGHMSGAQQCRMHFGYTAVDSFFDAWLPYSALNNSLVVTGYALADDTLRALPPQCFAANTSIDDAFSVPVPCLNTHNNMALEPYEGEAAVTWWLGDGMGHWLEATGYVTSAPPCETLSEAGTQQRPVAVYVDDPCIYRDAALGMCSVHFGYFNPNPSAIYAPMDPVKNALVYVALSKPPTVSPPATLFPGCVRDAVRVAWPCPDGTLDMHMGWRLTAVPGMSRIAMAEEVSDVMPWKKEKRKK